MTTSSRVTSMPRRTPVVGGDRLAQPGHAGRDRVAEHLLVEQPLGLLADRLRGARRGLAGDEVHQVAVADAAAAAPPRAGPSRGRAARWPAAPPASGWSCDSG